jgi:signal transduction histidine kinase
MHASAVLAELESVSRGEVGAGDARYSLDVLLKRIDEKCRPLCLGDGYSSSLGREDASENVLDDERVRGIVRLAQELVRNAVVHGSAERIRVDLRSEDAVLTLRIDDDGSGLSRERFEQATGGLANATAWLGDHGGHLSLAPPLERGTSLSAILPTS